MGQLFKKGSSREFWLMVTIPLTAFFVLCSYEFLRSSSTVLYKAAYGKESLAIIMALMPLSVLLVLYIYGRLLSWLGPRRTLFWSTVGSAAIILGSYIAIQRGSTVATAVLYLYRQAYIVLLIEQYWSFINSTIAQDAARKLNGPIAGISSLGGILGGLLVSQLAIPLGTEMMLLFAAIALIPAAFLSDLGYAKCGEPAPTRQEKEGKKGQLGLRVLRESPLLVLLLCVVMMTQVLAAVLNLSFQMNLSDAIPNADQQTAFQGLFFAGLNAASAFLQFVIAPLLLGFFALSPGIIQFCIPLIHLSVIITVIIFPSFTTIALAYFLFKCVDYSLFRASKEILYIPLSFDARYRSKEIIDVFGYRFGKGGTSLIISMLQNAGIALNNFYSWLAMGAILIWTALIIPILKHIPSRKNKTV